MRAQLCLNLSGAPCEALKGKLVVLSSLALSLFIMKLALKHLRRRRHKNLDRGSITPTFFSLRILVYEWVVCAEKGLFDFPKMEFLRESYTPTVEYGYLHHFSRQQI